MASVPFSVRSSRKKIGCHSLPLNRQWPMSTDIKRARRLWMWLAPLVGLAALALALFLYFHSPGDKPCRLRVTAGNETGMRHQLALNHGAEAERRNIFFDLRPSAG